jgi:hypothetical protein
MAMLEQRRVLTDENAWRKKGRAPYHYNKHNTVRTARNNRQILHPSSEYETGDRTTSAGKRRPEDQLERPVLLSKLLVIKESHYKSLLDFIVLPRC